jgi:hypothetical protein
VKKTIFITFELGMRGDYESLYKWLDEKKAEERGYGVAIIKEYVIDTSIKKDIDFLRLVKKELTQKVSFGNTDRVYMIWNGFENNLIKAGFIYGKAKQAPWTGFAEKDIDTIDLDI